MTRGLGCPSSMMPRLPEQPGTYRFTIKGRDRSSNRFYIGESDNLSRRMSSYRNPGPIQPTNVRLHGLLCETLERGGSADVAAVLKATIDSQLIDLKTKPGWLVVENVALVQLEAAGYEVENL
jgi:hypothetical protein